jgi:hypothetical protein
MQEVEARTRSSNTDTAAALQAARAELEQKKRAMEVRERELAELLTKKMADLSHALSSDKSSASSALAAADAERARLQQVQYTTFISISHARIQILANHPPRNSTQTVHVPVPVKLMSTD